jgi:hypothetical protein
MDDGYAPTIDIPRLGTPSRTTAPAPVILGTRPGTFGPGTRVDYFGSLLKDHGQWTVDGPCFCRDRCGKLRMWRMVGRDLHRLEHVSPRSVQRSAR